MSLIELKKITKLRRLFLRQNPDLIAVTFGYFCLNTASHHQMNMMTTANSSYIKQNKESCCGSNFSKYLESLKSNFTLPLRVDGYLLFFITSILLAFVMSLYPRNISNAGSLLRRLFLRQNPDLIAFNSLKLAFSDGIINPKVF